MLISASTLRQGLGVAGIALLLLSACGKSTHEAAESTAQADTGAEAGWPVFGGDAGGQRFSPLRQITLDNVDQLQVAWEYHTGDSSELKSGTPPTAFSATPILHKDTLYFCSGLSRAFAVDAATGKERWVYDSQPDMEKMWIGNCRGVALWSAPEQQGLCSTRIYMGTMDARLIALDADSGKPCDDFGTQGMVDLRQGMGDVEKGEMYMTSPPTVVGDLVVQGALVWDNHRIDAPPGVIRAWDARTGQLRWAFDPVPPGTPPPQHPLKGEAAPAGQLYYRGTPNSWGISSVDRERGLIFIPFGGTGIDFIGGHRRRFGFDLDYYGNSIVALHADSGKVAWHFQTVHHDLWDYDLAAQPLLFDFEKDGKKIPALAQASKVGHVFLLNRESGEPIYPVEERPVPQTTMPGEYTSATQPIPTFPKPLHPHGLTADDAWGFTFYDRAACRKKIEEADNRGLFTPPALNRYTIEYPGVAGGQNWGGMAYDPKQQLLVMPQSYVVTYNKLMPRDNKPEVGSTEEYLGYSPNFGTPYIIKHEILLSPFGVPCIAPPWGSLLAVDLKTGNKAWEIPFGTTRDMVPGLGWFPWAPNFGLPSAGGPIVTDSGLTFIGASMDNYIRAYDTASGKEVWRHRLPAGGQAVPITYRLQKNGKQFVVIAAGGHSSMRTTLGDSLIAFTLPD